MKDHALVDARGTVHRPAIGPSRIVCLVPSITELLFDLDLAEQVVGRTRFCVHPADKVASVALVGGTKTIKVAEVKALAPTHLIVNIDENPQAVVAELAESVPHVIVTHPIEPQDNLALYRLLGGIFHRQSAAEQLCRRFRIALSDLRKTAKHLRQRRVLYLIWRDPWMTVSASTYIARMLSLVGWTTVGHDRKVRYPIVNLSARLLEDTDIVLFSTEPYPFNRGHMESFQAEYADASPLVSLIDAQMTSWYGSRAIRGLAYLSRFATEPTRRGA